MNPRNKYCTKEITTSIQPPKVVITITKGNQFITLSPEEYAMMTRRMENAFINSLALVEE